MPEIQMPPQYVGTYPDPQDTEGHVRRAVATEAAQRLQLWTTFVLDAIREFESAATLHIDELDYDHDVTYSVNPVLGSFVTAVMDAFPETAVPASILSNALQGIQASYAQTLQGGLSGAKARLRASVFALAKATRVKTHDAASAILATLPKAVDDAWDWVDSASTDPAYVSAFCDWMGFVVPTDANTSNPVRQSLENPFFGMYQSARAQLLRAAGVPGLDGDDLNPSAWEHEAVKHQRDLYRQEGPASWDKAYSEFR